MRALCVELFIQSFVVTISTLSVCLGFTIEGDATMYSSTHYTGNSVSFPIYKGCFDFGSYKWAKDLAYNVVSLRLSSPTSCLRVYLHPGCLGHSAEVRGDDSFEICRRDLGNCGWRGIISSASGCSYDPGENSESSLLGYARETIAYGEVEGTRCSGRCIRWGGIFFCNAYGVEFRGSYAPIACFPRKAETTIQGLDCDTKCEQRYPHNICKVKELNSSVKYVPGRNPDWITYSDRCSPEILNETNLVRMLA